MRKHRLGRARRSGHSVGLGKNGGHSTDLGEEGGMGTAQASGSKKVVDSA